MPITVSGTSITFNDATTQTTAATSGVTSVATGNGLSGGTITTSGTLTVACPSFNSVGSYVTALATITTTGTITAGSTYSAGTGNFQIQSIEQNNGTTQNNLSGTWRWMAASGLGNQSATGIACRVA